MNIISFGDKAANVADELYKLDKKYNLIKIGVDVAVSVCKNMEQYERLDLDISYRLCYPESIVIIRGEDSINGLVLKVLEKIKERSKFYIVYLRQDKDLLTKEEQLVDKICYNVLQEYTRSGVFERIYLVDLSLMDGFFEKISVKDYTERVDSTIAYVVHMNNYFSEADAIFGNIKNFIHDESARIATFGFVDIESGIERKMFNLASPKEKSYHINASDRDINENIEFRKEVMRLIKSRKVNDLENIVFGVYNSNLEKSVCLSFYYCSVVQQ